MEDEAQQFIQDLEARFGGPVTYRTYSTWFASNEGIIREFGVFVFVIDGIFHFEDFERKPAIFGFAMKPRKNEPKYVKFERSFRAQDVKNVTLVSKSRALSCADGYIKQESIAPANRYEKLMRPIVTRLVLIDGTTYFCELIEQKKFIQALKGE
jgi:hypothetical protein